jgi:TolA-binding protein
LALELLQIPNQNKLMGDSRLKILGLWSLMALMSAAAWADSLASRDFSIAKSLFTEGKENEALVSFTDFLRRHGDDALADDAQYFVGEIYFRKRQFPEAIAEFRKVLKFRKGDRVADAFLRVGESQMRLGNSRAALIEFEAVRRNFPKSEFHDRAVMAIEGLLNPEKKK